MVDANAPLKSLTDDSVNLQTPSVRYTALEEENQEFYKSSFEATSTTFRRAFITGLSTLLKRYWKN